MDWWSEDIFGNECWSIGLKGIKQEPSETILPIRAQGSNDWKEALQVGHGPIHALANDTGGHFGDLRSLQQGTSVTNISKLNDDHFSDDESDDGNGDNEDNDDDSDDDSDDDDDDDSHGSDDDDDDSNGSDDDDSESGSVIVLDSDSSNKSSNVTFPTVKSELIDNINEVDSKFMDCISNTDGNIYKLRNRVVTEGTSQVDVTEDVNSITKSLVLEGSDEIRETIHCIGFMGNDIESNMWQNSDALEDDVDSTSLVGLQTRNSLQSETMLTQPLVQCDFSQAAANPYSCSLCKTTFSNK